MPNFDTAEELVNWRVFKQRVDEGGLTTFEVVDRFLVGNRVIATFETETEADARRDQRRVARVAQLRHLAPGQTLLGVSLVEVD